MKKNQIAQPKSNRGRNQTCDPVKVRENSGFNKKGYKKTKLGWIPEEWKVVKLKNISKSFSGGTPSRSQPEYYGGNIHWIKSGELNQGIITKTDEFITQLGLNNSAAKMVKPQTLLIAMYGATAGVVAISKIEGAINQAVLALNLDKKIELLFLYNYLKKRMPRIVQSLVQGGQPNLNGRIINNLKVILPPFPEQQKIATILSTWDRAIAKQQQLIAAKQEYKKGLMQLLLTGKLRFAGFEGEWETKTLSDILIIGNGRDHKHLPDGDIPVYGTGGIMRYVNDYLFDGKSVGIGRKGTIDKPVFLEGKFWTVDTLFYCHSFKESIAIYIYYLFLTINWKKYNEASGVPSLSQNTIKKIKVSIPKVKEQQKIACVLSAAGSEIALLESELEQMREQKRGLMQRLLTGEVRVKV